MATVRLDPFRTITNVHWNVSDEYSVYQVGTSGLTAEKYEGEWDIPRAPWANVSSYGYDHIGGPFYTVEDAYTFWNSKLSSKHPIGMIMLYQEKGAGLAPENQAQVDFYDAVLDWGLGWGTDAFGKADNRCPPTDYGWASPQWVSNAHADNYRDAARADPEYFWPGDAFPPSDGSGTVFDYTNAATDNWEDAVIVSCSLAP